MKARYRLFRRHNGIFFCEDRETRQQESLRTKDRAEATRLLCAKNEAHQQPGFGLHVARAYLAAADPALARKLQAHKEKLAKGVEEKSRKLKETV